MKTAALLYGNDDAFTQAGYDVFKQALQANGIQITSEQTFAKGDKDFSPQLTVIKGANPDAVFVSALADEAAGIVVAGAAARASTRRRSSAATASTRRR